MNGDERSVHLLSTCCCIVLVASSLIGMRLPLGKAAKMIARLGCDLRRRLHHLFAFRGEFSALGQRLTAEATGSADRRWRGSAHPDGR